MARRYTVREVMDKYLHLIPQVGLVGTIILHGMVEGHATEGTEVHTL